MTTKLEGPLKREIAIGDSRYTLTITPDGMTLAAKGRRKGLALEWRALVSGEAALATALNASLKANLGASPREDPARAPAAKTKRRHRG